MALILEEWLGLWSDGSERDGEVEFGNRSDEW